MRKKHLILSALIVLIPIGLLMKAFGSHWWANSFAGVLYVVFFCLLGRLIFARVSSATICMTVLTATCALEFLQLVDTPPLAWVRSYPLGRILIGTTFAWSDFAYYGLGAVAAWLALELIRRQ